MNAKLEYLLALWTYRYYLHRDRIARRARRWTDSLGQLVVYHYGYWRWVIARTWFLWVDTPTSTRYIDCAIVNLRTYWLQGWALRIVTVLFLVSLMTHLPAPTGAQVYSGAGQDVAALSQARRTAERQSEQYRALAHALLERTENSPDRMLLAATRDKLALRDTRHDHEVAGIAARCAETYGLDWYEVAEVTQ